MEPSDNRVGEIPRHPEPGSADAREVARNPRDEEIESSDSSSDVGGDIGSRVDRFEADKAIHLGHLDLL